MNLGNGWPTGVSPQRGRIGRHHPPAHPAGFPRPRPARWSGFTRRCAGSRSIATAPFTDLPLKAALAPQGQQRVLAHLSRIN
jgi:hypothetical protein